MIGGERLSTSSLSLEWSPLLEAKVGTGIRCTSDNHHITLMQFSLSLASALPCISCLSSLFDHCCRRQLAINLQALVWQILSLTDRHDDPGQRRGATEGQGATAASPSAAAEGADRATSSELTASGVGKGVPKVMEGDNLEVYAFM